MRRVPITEEIRDGLRGMVEAAGAGDTADRLQVHPTTLHRILNGETQKCSERVAAAVREAEGRYDAGGGPREDERSAGQAIRIPCSGGVTINITTDNVYLTVGGEVEKEEPATG